MRRRRSRRRICMAPWYRQTAPSGQSGCQAGAMSQQSPGHPARGVVRRRRLAGVLFRRGSLPSSVPRRGLRSSCAKSGYAACRPACSHPGPVLLCRCSPCGLLPLTVHPRQEAARRETMRASAAQEAKDFVQMMRQQTEQERYEEEQRSGSTRLLGEAELERARWLESQRAGRRSARRARRATGARDRRRYADDAEESDSDGWVTDEPEGIDSAHSPRREPRRDGGHTSLSDRGLRGATHASNAKSRSVSIGRRHPEAWEANVSSRQRETSEAAAAAAALQRELGSLKLLALHERALQDGGEPEPRCLSWLGRLCYLTSF